jgi:hypothetical protein
MEDSARVWKTLDGDGTSLRERREPHHHGGADRPERPMAGDLRTQGRGCLSSHPRARMPIRSSNSCEGGRPLGRHSQRRACCTCCCKPLLHAFHRLRAAKPQQHTLPQVGTSQAQVPFRRLRLASRLAGRGSCGAAHAPHRVAVRIRRSSEGCLAHKDRSRTSPTNPSFAGRQKCPGRGLNPPTCVITMKAPTQLFSKVPRTGFEPAPLA